MNDSIYQDSPSATPWPNGDYQRREPNTSVLLDSGEDAPATVGLLNQAIQGAHKTIDRFAERAVPAVRQLGESVTEAKDALHGKVDQFTETRDEWVQSVRATVRSNPLASVAAAVTLGAVIARVTHRKTRSGLT